MDKYKVYKSGSLQQLINRCNKLGVYLQDDGMNLDVDAPRGYVITAVGCHYLSYHYIGNASYTKTDCYRYLLTDLSMGIEKCEYSKCELCAEDWETEEFFENVIAGRR